MSIEVRNDGSAPVDIESQPAIAPRAPISIRPWQKHRYQVGSLLVGLVLVAALVANNFLARQYSPDGAVRQYLSAVESGDSSTAWKLITIAGGSSAVNLTDRAALEASFASGRPDVKSFTVDQPTTLDSNTAAVNFTYLTSGGTKDGSFVVKRAPSNNLGVYPAWEVAIKPVALHLGVPSGAGGVLVDGKALELSGPMDVGVLPLAHKIRIVGTAMVEPQTVAVDAFSGQPQTVTYSPTLTPLGAQKATATIKAAFTSCAKLTGVRPGGCPQAVDVSAVNSGQWQLVGDPTQNLSFAVDASANLVGEGHFQMVFSYQESGVDGAIRRPSAGGFQAILNLTTGDVSVTSIKAATGLPAVERPAAATDQAVISMVAKAMNACATVASGNSGACPQAFFFSDATDFSWTLVGDPMSGASVVFDSNTGMITVKGSFDMQVSYKISGYPYSGHSNTSTYVAYLFWDGQRLVLVTIDGE